MVVGHPVDVVKDESHHAALPELPLTAQLAHRLLEPFGIQASLQW